MKTNYRRIISLPRFFICVWFLCDASGRKADDMCKKYGEYVFAEEDSPVMLPGAKKDRTSQCGIVEVPLIVGGEKAGPKEFPHMAVLGFGGPTVKEAHWMCGGALLSERFVLTAAHCLKSRDFGEVRWVRMGDTNLNGTNDDANEMVRGVAQRIPHPDFKLPSNYHDIALVKVDRDVAFDAYTRPACLYAQDQPSVKTAIATGFGRLGYETEKTSRDLLKVQLPFVSNEDCNDVFKSGLKSRSLANGIVSSQMCAGEKEGGKDTCQGDSGGPLQTVLEEPYCMYSIIGVTSFGKFCGMANSPAVYTRISHYISWIEGIVWP